MLESVFVGFVADGAGELENVLPADVSGFEENVGADFAGDGELENVFEGELENDFDELKVDFPANASPQPRMRIATRIKMWKRFIKASFFNLYFYIKNKKIKGHLSMTSYVPLFGFFLLSCQIIFPFENLVF